MPFEAISERLEIDLIGVFVCFQLSKYFPSKIHFLFRKLEDVCLGLSNSDFLQF